MSNLYNWIFNQPDNANRKLLSTQSGNYTFGDIHQRVEEYVHLLESLGDLKRKRVALIVPSVFNFITLVLAISKLGGISIPVSPLLRKEDLVSVLDFADPHIVFTANSHNGFPISESVRNWAASAKKQTTIFEEEVGNWKEIDIFGVKRELSEDDFIEIIGCTSGSTGTPKGVAANVDYFKRADEALLFSLNLTDYDKLFLAGPAVGLYGLCFLLSSLHSRYHLVITESFNFPDIIRLLEEHPSKKLMTTPSLFKAIDLFSKTMGKKVLEPIELLCIGGEAVTKEFIQSYIKFPAKMINLYGLSELGPVLYSENDIQDDESLSIIPNVKFKLESDTEEGMGELLLKTVHPFLGYYKRPDLTTEVYKDGWYYSGDFARNIADGKIEIIGRKKEMIKKGGQQIIPGEIENFLSDHPSVEKAVVIGVPHAVFGEQLVAFVKKINEIEIKELYEYCNEKIARFKIPDQIRFINEFPMIQGKVDKITLRKLVSEK